MGAGDRELNRVKAVELEMRGRAIEDSIRGAARALAADGPDGLPARRLTAISAAYPFETALRMKLRSMELQFAALVQNAPQAMIVVDEKANVVFSNIRAQRLFGYSDTEPLECTLWELVSGGRLEALRAKGAEAALAEIGDGAAPGIEVVGHRRDGGTFPAEIMIGLVETSNGTLSCLAVRDLGAAKAEQRRSAEVERRLRLAFDHLPDAVVVVNARARVTQFNAKAQALFGVAAHEIVGKAANRVLPEAVIEQIVAALVAPLGVVAANNFAARIARKDGQEIAVDIRLALAEDERTRSAIIAIREEPALTSRAGSADLRRAAAEASPQALIAVRSDGIIGFANARAETLFGASGEGLCGLGVAELVPSGFPDAAGSGLEADSTEALLLSGRRRDGTIFPVEVLVGYSSGKGEVLRIATLRELPTGGAGARPARDVRQSEARIDGDHHAEVPLASLTLDSIGDALVSMDLAGNVYFLNQAAEQLTGWTWKDAAGRPVREIVNVVESGTGLAFGDQIAGAGNAAALSANVALIRRDGREIPIEGSIAPIESRDGRPAGRVMIFRDVSLARAQAQEMAHSAQHDPLTGLPNRTLLNDRISSAISIAPRHQKRVAVLFLDLDGFKQINDSLGHATGDKLLQAVADRLMGCVRGSDTVSRIGGDEFVVLLSEVERAEDSAITARRMLEAVSEPYLIDQHELRITVSIGVSAYPDDGIDAETLIKNADAAMYQAKENGRQGYQFYKPAMNLRAVERQDVEEALREALEREEFALHFQPKVDLRNGEIAGAEALLRWDHPKKGAVSPALFVPVAEASGLIVPIGRWVMREACRQVHAWQKAGLPVPSVAINVSSIEFAAPQFLETVFETLNETGLAPNALELEFTERALMKRADTTQAILEALSAGGVQMSVDDFGTGYSSLSTLRRFPIQMLKIDQSFVREIRLRGADADLVTAVLTMAQSLKLRVVAEGVETAEELAFLQEHRCDQAQGYYFSRPLPPAEFSTLLRNGLVSTMAARRFAHPFGRLHNHAITSH